MYGFQFNIEKNVEDSNSVIFHPPLQGAPPETGHFEVPQNDEGERFLIHAIAKANKDHKEKTEVKEEEKEITTGSYL